MGENNSIKENIYDDSNPWFVVSVITTIFLIGILTWNVIHSYRIIRNFEETELALEKAAGELLFHSKTSEMAVFMAVFTGDLRWQDSYKEHKPQLNNAIKEIDSLTKKQLVSQKIKKIKRQLGRVNKIEDKAFTLISRGDKEEAEKLLKGWIYTKNQLGVRETTQELKDVLTAEVSREINRQKRTTLILLILVIISLVVLIISWYISINQWLKSIKERKEKEEEIIFLSYHDTLTNLCNRRSFMKAAQEEIKQAKSLDQYLAIIMIDIDNFKTINDNFGHDIGDLVLKRVAARLKDNLSQDDIISRIGGDEFTIIITDISSKKDSKQKINNLVNAFDNPLSIEESKLFISISTGISFYPNDDEQLEKLIKKADDAMYRAKKEQKGQVFYSNY